MRKNKKQFKKAIKLSNDVFQIQIDNYDKQIEILKAKKEKALKLKHFFDYTMSLSKAFNNTK